ncbi:oxidative stress defense protein [Shewanella sp. Isolate7]|uniref:oxidative stress defense protein n=1 Tax=Shewanella sp. Isolate7 TaxID=2908528 RepID=UPI001EFEDDAB|nr:oxidative stress defense protein [Shewanella sp. Isolate7]MCG9722573.1 oxidative stress defense protein [Shewanella sp. Isolate7]
MKKTLIATLFGSLVFTGSLLALPGAAAAELKFPHIETVGTSELVVKADMAELTVEVVTKADNPAKAKAGSDKAVSDFLARLAKSGIAREDIHSANLNLQPEYLYDPETRTNKEIGYRASRQVVVTLRALDKLNDLLDSALQQGINRIHQINFKSSKEQEMIEQARLMAIKDATQKAAALAEGFGERLDGVWEIRYQAQGPVRPMVYKMSAAARGDIAESYQEAQTSISDRVEVIYRLK